MKPLFIVVVIIGLLVIFTGCASTPPDFPLCVEMSMVRGECIKVISGQKITVDETHKMYGKTWWSSRPTNMILPLESWMVLKKFIIKLCKENDGMCDKQVSTWERSLETIDQAVEEKAPVSQSPSHP